MPLGYLLADAVVFGVNLLPAFGRPRGWCSCSCGSTPTSPRSRWCWSARWRRRRAGPRAATRAHRAEL